MALELNDCFRESAAGTWPPGGPGSASFELPRHRPEAEHHGVEGKELRVLSEAVRLGAVARKDSPYQPMALAGVAVEEAGIEQSAKVIERVPDGGVAPVDDPGDLVVIDKDVARVKVPMQKAPGGESRDQTLVAVDHGEGSLGQLGGNEAHIDEAPETTTATAQRR